LFILSFPFLILICLIRFLSFSTTFPLSFVFLTFFLVSSFLHCLLSCFKHIWSFLLVIIQRQS
jgi:hypothetical protein